MNSIRSDRPWWPGRTVVLAVGLLAVALAGPAWADAAKAPFVMIVMDPLAKPLSCPCVQGYAQRDYQQLADKLSQDLDRPVEVVFNESLKSALEGDAKGRADLVIGKRSVVLYDAKRTMLPITPVAALTNKEGGTTIKGLIVVPSTDPVSALSALQGYRLIFGPAESDEKHAAAIALLKSSGVEIPQTLETAAACDEGALAILEDAKSDLRGAAVISSYAAPLLEGCGTVAKGALRVVGETAPVPFIQAFVRSDLAPAERDRITRSLKKATSDPLLRIALETQEGFVPVDDASVVAKKK